MFIVSVLEVTPWERKRDAILQVLLGRIGKGLSRGKGSEEGKLHREPHIIRKASPRQRDKLSTAMSGFFGRFHPGKDPHFVVPTSDVCPPTPHLSPRKPRQRPLNSPPLALSLLILPHPLEKFHSGSLIYPRLLPLPSSSPV